MITSISNSRNNLSFTISRCNKPKNPHLYPCQSAGETVDSTFKAESFKTSFSIASFKFGYSAESIGKIQANIKGLDSENHSIAFAVSALSFGHSTFAAFQRVSPTLACSRVFNHVTTYQTEPFSIFLSLTYLGEKYHTSRASIFLFV
ncbi:hypothetical protein LDC_2576 [sediment metagenome]|uniref:Uncharacterized protein n=1 Tax=sediment metagenome TaxID=749907 RepID=D9PM00_9ZZZZ